MIDRQELLADLKPLMRELEADLRARCDEVVQISADLTKEYEEARAANRVGVTFEEWRADLITQVAVAWVLSCVFVRFLEDNALISPPRISGPLHGVGDGQGLMRARDERDVFFRSRGTQTDRDYLLAVFDGLAKLPGSRDVFGPHNPVSAYRDWLSGDAAQKLIEFFQKIDADGTGEIVHSFTDDQWDTRFLGDLYQDLSEAARKKYALLQTPVFVEEFILERTLEPAVNEFGLKGLKMIDPACGSGHFLLGSFARILNHWRKAEPGTNDRELVNLALASVHGVDLNPYAIAIARFRLLVAAMKECEITRLKDAPGFQFNLACGDSLLHGSPDGEQLLMGYHELAHHYQSEDIDELRQILKPGQYHAVVANPPYVTVKDKAVNQAYRKRYPEVCYRVYSLSAPFLQRLFVLACDSGFTGQITANSFMKREFGKKLVEGYLSKIDLTHVIDTACVHLPGHGTSTAILLARHRPPVGSSIRLVSTLKNEEPKPAVTEKGKVWLAVVAQADHVGSKSEFVTVSDTPREQFGKHPWSIGGGGASELKELLDEGGERVLLMAVDKIGRTTVVGEDDVWIMDAPSGSRVGIRQRMVPLVTGECVRDWGISDLPHVLYPYTTIGGSAIPASDFVVQHYLQPFRASLQARSVFGKTMADNGRGWWEHLEHYTDKLRTPLSIVFGFVATHNHFVLDRGGKVFNRSAPVIKLPASATEDDHLALLGLLNSSTACFWMKQVFYNKGGGGISEGVKAEAWERFFEHDGTKVKRFPLPGHHPIELSKRLNALSADLSDTLPDHVATGTTPDEAKLSRARQANLELRGQMIAAQEELDWECYHLYGLLADTPRCDNPPRIKVGQRAFEIVLARKMAIGEEKTTWFVRHGSAPITEIPAEWPEEYRRVVERRIQLIESDRNIGLIERLEYKRRWNTEPWEQQQKRALRNWLLGRLESYFDLDGRMNDRKTATVKGNLHEPRLTSVAKVADLAKQDKDFMLVAELYAGRMDFDMANLVGDLITAESVPCLPILRYKPSGMDKRAAWERTWELQRLEDAVDALFEVERLKKIEPYRAQESLPPLMAALRIEEQVKLEVSREVVNAAGYVAEAAKQELDLASELILKPVKDATKRAKQRAVGDIPVPPKYTSADFLSSDFWRLRGKLDVPKERWVSFPHCEGEDGTLMIAWAGYDHLQLVRAIAERYEHAKEYEGRKLVPLLACIGQQIPWLKQWHNDLDPAYGTRMGDYFEDYLAQEAKVLNMTVEQVMAWQPPTVNGTRRPRRNRSNQ